MIYTVQLTYQLKRLIVEVIANNAVEQRVKIVLIPTYEGDLESS